MNHDYDFEGSVRRLEQRRPWKRGGLDHVPNRESFDAVFSVAGKVVEHTDYTYGGEVYRIDRHAYDEAGRLVRSVQFDKNGSEVAISECENCESKQLCVTRDSSGIVIGHGVHEFNDGFLTLMGSYDANGLPRRLKTFEYEKGVLSKAVSKYLGTNGALLETSITRFDSLGRPLEAFGLKPDGKPTGDGRYTYEYDDRGRVHKILSYNDLEDIDIPNSIAGFEYICDELGNWIERRKYHRFRSDPDWSRNTTTRKLIYYK